MYILIISSCKNYLNNIDIIKFYSVAQTNSIHNICVYVDSLFECHSFYIVSLLLYLHRYEYMDNNRCYLYITDWISTVNIT